jgi:hypothetical protein
VKCSRLWHLHIDKHEKNICEDLLVGKKAHGKKFGKIIPLHKDIYGVKGIKLKNHVPRQMRVRVRFCKVY